MRIPTDVSLVTYIRNLIDTDRLFAFYKTDDWLELREEVLIEHHYECQECLKRGRYSRADCVHHVNEVKKRPDLALSRTYKDKDGQEHKQLIPLCNVCHNNEHKRFSGQQGKDRFVNEERW